MSNQNSTLHNHSHYREKAGDIPPERQALKVPDHLKNRLATIEEYEEAMADFLNGN